MEKPYTRDSQLPEGRALPQKPDRSKMSEEIKQGRRFSRMAPAEHLHEAQKALSEGYKIGKNPVQNVWGKVNDARKHLKAIEPESSQFNAAQGLLHKTLLREKHIEHACVSIANLIMVKQREMMVFELEQYYVNRGIFASIELSGPDKTSLKLACPLFREASIDRIADDTNFFACLRRAGFKRVVLGDSEENIWTYRLEK